MLTHGPLVSVGVPVYNGARYLREALNALLIQEYDHFEVIVVDNASTDETAAIGRQFAARDHRIRFHQNKRNLGAIANFNLAFAMARGKYFSWAAHDDLRRPDYLKKCVQALEGNPVAVLACPWYSLIDEDGNVIEIPKDNLLAVAAGTKAGRLRRLFARNWPAGLVYGVIRTEALAYLSPVLRTVWAPDVVLLVELCLLGDIVIIPEALLSIRRFRGKSLEHVASTLDHSFVAKSSLCRWASFSREVVRVASHGSRAVPERIALTFAAVGGVSRHAPSWVRLAVEHWSYSSCLGPAIAHLRLGHRWRSMFLAGTALLTYPPLIRLGAWKVVAEAALGPRAAAFYRKRRTERTRKTAGPE